MVLLSLNRVLWCMLCALFHAASSLSAKLSLFLWILRRLRLRSPFLLPCSSSDPLIRIPNAFTPAPVWTTPNTKSRLGEVIKGLQMTACGSLDLEVPRRNFRSAAFVSGEKVYRRPSEDCGIVLSASRCRCGDAGLREEGERMWAVCYHFCECEERLTEYVLRRSWGDEKSLIAKVRDNSNKMMFLKVFHDHQIRDGGAG